MQKTPLLIIHETDGKEFYTSMYACHDRQLTPAEKWLIDLNCEEATMLLNYVANDEDICELERIFNDLPSDDTKKALGEISKSWFGSWKEIHDISLYSEQNHCVIYVRSMSC